MPVDFKAVLSDLTSMASTFHDQATNYRKLHDQVAPPWSAAGTPAWTTPSKKSPTSSSPSTRASPTGWTTGVTRSRTPATPSTGTTSTSTACSTT